MCQFGAWRAITHSIMIELPRAALIPMNRTILNLLIDLCAACLFLAMFVTGYILRFPLPPETNKTFSLWGLTRHEWGAIHFWISLGLIAIILVHLALHWTWIVSVIGKRLGAASKTHPRLLRVAVICSMLLTLSFGLFAWAAHQSVSRITDIVPGVCLPEPQPDITPASEPGNDNSSHPAIRFWQDVYPLLETKCLSCHGPKRQLGNFRVDRREDFFKTYDNGSLVVPGKTAESRLIDLISGHWKDSKLNDKHRLAEKDVLLLKAWIDGGADWPANHLRRNKKSLRSAGVRN